MYLTEECDIGVTIEACVSLMLHTPEPGFIGPIEAPWEPQAGSEAATLLRSV